MTTMKCIIRGAMSHLERFWHSCLNIIESWLEWQTAKVWAKRFHPGWVAIVNVAKNEETRTEYRNAILKAYRRFKG